MKPKLPYDTFKDFVAITQTVRFPLVLGANPGVPGDNLKEFLAAAAKQPPNKFNYASTGVGSLNHLAPEELKRLSKVELLHVPYGGGGPAIQAVVGGQANMTWLSFAALRNRAPWLLFNLCTAATASFVASQFEGTVSQIVILAFLMSIVAGIGGNSGNQTMTLIIRALAMGRITGRNLWQLVKRELFVTLMVGLCGSLVAALFAWVISHSLSIALVMMAAMICNMLVGASVGVLVPMVRARFGKDPAMGSSVLLTFATDSLGFFIFLGLATKMCIRDRRCTD